MTMPVATLRWSHLLLLACLLPWCAAAQAQAVRTERVSLAEGSDAVLLRGTIQGQQAVAYVVVVESGRRIAAELTSEHRQLFMNVRAPGATATTQAGPTAGNLYAAEATASGELRLTIFLLGEAARRGDSADYALSVELAGVARPAAPAPPQTSAPPAATHAPPPAATQAPPPAAAAPVETAVPALWTVTGLPRGQRLNVRSGPSLGDRVVARIPVGERLRAAGDCRMVSEERWCPVERAEGPAGWVASRFLGAVPGSSPVVAAPEASARRFDATGVLPCAMVRGQTSRECRFGVTRPGHGAAVLEVLGSNGITRRIVFERGAPLRCDGRGEVTFERFGDLFLLRCGEERFEVPEAVVNGG